MFCKEKRAARFHEQHHSDFNYDILNFNDSVKYERERVLENQRNNNDCYGLRIVGLNKTYNKSLFFKKSSTEVHAVRDLYLEVDDGELLSLLGHNGAGIYLYA
jgi:ABC-type glutathione transport system ATPase component